MTVTPPVPSPSHPHVLVGRDGTLYSARTGRPYSVYAISKGYLQLAASSVMPCCNGRRNLAVHVLVAEAFHGPRPRGKHAAHDNGNKRDNAATNVLWKTPAENEADKVRHGTRQRGSMVHTATLDEQDAYHVRALLALPQPMNCARIARIYGVAPSTITRIAAGRTWAHVSTRIAA